MAYEGLRLSSKGMRLPKPGKPDGSARAAAAKPAATWAPSDATGRFSQSDIDRAVGQAVKAERSRVAAVFASPASFGRERGCARLLSNAQGWTAAQISRELPLLPTDRDLAAGEARQRNSRGHPVWEKAYAVSAAEREGEPSAARAQTASNDVWAKAYATNAAHDGGSSK